MKRLSELGQELLQGFEACSEDRGRLSAGAPAMERALACLDRRRELLVGESRVFVGVLDRADIMLGSVRP
jgi:hypothetical protein